MTHAGALVQALRDARQTGKIMVVSNSMYREEWFVNRYPFDPELVEAREGSIRYVLPNGEVTKLS